MDFTYEQKVIIYLDYKLSRLFSNYDLHIYDLNGNTEIENKVYRADLKSDKNSTFYKTLNVVTRKWNEKTKISTFDEFCENTTEEYRRKRNYVVGNVNDWYKAHKERIKI